MGVVGNRCKKRAELPALTTLQMEIAVAKCLKFVRNIVVPCVGFGWGIHECDLLMVNAAGYCTEVEIKISKSDFIADGRKQHQHIDKLDRINNFYFAVPVELLDFALDNVPDRAGIIIVTRDMQCRVLKACTPLKTARKVTTEEQLKLAHLGAMRIWGLKQKIADIGVARGC